MNRPRRIAVVALAAVLGLPMAASAAWLATATGATTAATGSIGAGQTPTGSASGTTINLSWQRTQLSSGVDATSYTVTDYSAPTGGSAQATQSCPGSGVATVTCSLSNQGSGSHYFTVTPAYGNWTGVSSGRSAAVSVAAAGPAGLSFSSVTTGSNSGNAVASVTCTGTVGSAGYACTISPEVVSGKSRFMQAVVTLVDSSGNQIDNPGAAITVNLSKDGGTLDRTTVSIPGGSSASSNSFKLSLPNGGEQHVVTATATVNGNSVSANITS